MEEKWYAYWLCTIGGIGNHTIMGLLANDRYPEDIFKASSENLKAFLRPKQLEALVESRAGGLERIKKEYEKLQEQEIKFYWLFEEAYPKRLQHIPDPPFGIFVKGQLPKEENIAVAVVGARDCSEYGRYVATELGRYLGERGISLISGMARGIDGISQSAALERGGMSYGVLGCGVDICYPAQNRDLYRNLIQSGGILSEYVPGTLPKAQHFPPRNRIVSGLADALVVIEARNQSGTLITVDMALEQGKEVYVVPGRVTDRLSDGCNSLLKQGAEVFLNPEEFVRELGEKFGVGEQQFSDFSSANKVSNNSTMTDYVRVNKYNRVDNNSKDNNDKNDSGEKTGVEENLKEELKQILDFDPKSVQEIAQGLSQQYSLPMLNVELLKLCLEGGAQQLSTGYFCRKND